MDLKMYLKGQLVDTAVINVLKLNHSAGYIHLLKMEMEERNEDIIELSNEEPEFFIDHIPSSMNNGNRFLKSE